MRWAVGAIWIGEAPPEKTELLEFQGHLAPSTRVFAAMAEEEDMEELELGEDDVFEGDARAH